MYHRFQAMSGNHIHRVQRPDLLDSSDQFLAFRSRVSLRLHPMGLAVHHAAENRQMEMMNAKYGSFVGIWIAHLYPGIGTCLPKQVGFRMKEVRSGQAVALFCRRSRTLVGYRSTSRLFVAVITT